MRMNEILRTVCGVLVVGLLCAATPSAQNPDEQAIRTTIDHYLQGMATGDGARLRAAFHPEARLFQAMGDGKLSNRTAEEFAASAAPPQPGAPAAKQQILSVDQTGSAAVVKVELDYGAIKFIDYLSMLKLDGQWKIMNKTFARVAPPATR